MFETPLRSISYTKTNDRSDLYDLINTHIEVFYNRNLDGLSSGPFKFLIRVLPPCKTEPLTQTVNVYPYSTLTIISKGNTSKTCPCNIQRLKISPENFDTFLIFAQNIDCGYMLEPPC